MNGIDWGDVPTWLGAFFAAGAATAAVWTLASQRTQLGEQRQFIALQAANLNLERRALQAAAEERRSGQARQIVLRGSASDYEPVMESGEVTGVFIALQWRVEVGNASREPIHDVRVRAGDHEIPHVSPVGPYDPQAPAWQRRRQDAVEAPLPLLGSGASCLFESDALEGWPPWSEQPVCFFTDHDGVRWRLDGHGDLSEVHDES